MGINKNGLIKYGKDFVIEQFKNNRRLKYILLHEVLHLVLGHHYFTSSNQLIFTLANIAQDIVINNMIIEEFGGKRKSISEHWWDYS